MSNRDRDRGRVRHFAIALAACLGALAANAEELQLFSIQQLPAAARPLPKSELATLGTPLDEISRRSLSEACPSHTEYKINGGYGYLQGNKEVQLPDNWVMTSYTAGAVQTKAIAVIRRGAAIAEIAFESRGLFAKLGRFAGSPSASVFGAFDLNSRFLAVEGSGDWNYRFFDKSSGAVLPVAVVAPPNHLVAIFVNRSGTPYIEDVPLICKSGGEAQMPARGRGSALRELRFGAVSLTAPLTAEQAQQWPVIGSPVALQSSGYTKALP